MPMIQSTRKAMASDTSIPKPISLEAFRLHVKEVSEKEEEGFFPADHHMRKDYQATLEELLSSDGQLRRILVARKYDLPSALDLIQQQMRFRARWNPRHIQPSQISTSLPGTSNPSIPSFSSSTSTTSSWCAAHKTLF